MKARPIVVQTSYREVFNQLEDAILRGELKIDEPLPTEAELCDILQVKRSTVREGIRLLEQSGLVTRNSARRLVVSAPDASRSSENIIRSVTLNKVTLEELWRVQRELEALASRLACDKHFQASARGACRQYRTDAVVARRSQDHRQDRHGVSSPDRACFQQPGPDAGA